MSYLYAVTFDKWKIQYSLGYNDLLQCELCMTKRDARMRDLLHLIYQIAHSPQLLDNGVASNMLIKQK